MPVAMRVLIVAMILNVTGSSLLWPLNAIYITEHIGQTLTVAGTILMFQSIASVIGNMLGGWIFDRYGGYPALLGGSVIALVSTVGLVFMNDWPSYPILLILLGLGGGLVFPSMYASAAVLWPEGERRTFNNLYVAQNVGVAVGSAVGGWLAILSFDWVFLGLA
ncbi:MAG: MFS transporter, partial [Bacilli bacterium]